MFSNTNVCLLPIYISMDSCNTTNEIAFMELHTFDDAPPIKHIYENKSDADNRCVLIKTFA